MIKTALYWIGGILTVAALVALLYKVDCRWEKSELHAKDVAQIWNRVEFLEQRQQQQISLDKAQKLQERIWQLERFYQGRRMPEPVRREIMYHQEEIKNIYKGAGKEPGGVP